MYKVVQKDPGQGSAAAQSETTVQLADDAPDFTVENEVPALCAALCCTVPPHGGCCGRLRWLAAVQRVALTFSGSTGALASLRLKKSGGSCAVLLPVTDLIMLAGKQISASMTFLAYNAGLSEGVYTFEPG